MSKLTIYKASAGSGKTFMLSSNYLNLVIANPESYKHILAVTFTHKATGEMKSRIIKELYILASGQQSEHMSSIKQKTGLADEEIVKRAKKVLSLILHDYGRFNIGTIDGFFQKIIRGFIREIGLQTGMNVELDTKKVLSNVVNDLFADLDEQEDLKKWLIRYAESRIEQGSNWNFTADLIRFSEEVFKEQFQSHQADLNTLLEDKGLLTKYQSTLLLIKKKFEEDLQTMGEKGLAAISAHGVSVDDFAYGISGPAGFFLKLDSKAFVNIKFELPSRILAALDDSSKWASKSAPNRDQLIQLAESELHFLAQKAIDYFRENHKHYLSVEAALKNIYVLGITFDLSKKIREYTADKNIFLLSDAGVFLKEIINNQDIPFIYEKVGTFYKHFMIDEFQDTSESQWNNFKPLIENSLAAGNFNLIVGDVKQSIYRWRNSNWNLLAEQVKKDFREDQLVEENLKFNYRSDKNIILFNNRLFSVAAALLQTEINALIEQSDESENEHFKTKIVDAYGELVQKFKAEKNVQGYIRLDFVSSELKAQEKDELVLNQLLNSIKQLQDNGVQAGDIAILIRKKSEGVKIADFLLEQKKQDSAKKYCLDIISNEALYLKNSHAINLIMAFLHVLKDKDDAVHLSVVKASYYKLNGLSYTHEAFENCEVSDQKLPEELKKSLGDEFLNELKGMPLYELIDKLIQVFNLGQFETETPYILSLQDMVKESVSRGITDVHSFIHWWNEYALDKTIHVSEGLHAIRILTVHKSKGLEFQSVLVPFCDWDLDHAFDPILWVEPKSDDLKQMPVIPVAYKNLLKSEFSTQYLWERLQVYVDQLNLLYVAFTRAKSNLIVSALIDKDDRIKSIGDVIHYALRFREFEPNEWKLTLPDSYDELAKRFEHGAIVPSFKKEEEPVEMLKTYPLSTYRNKLALKFKSQDYFSTDEGNDAINYGKMMHRVFASIKTKDDIDDAINEMILEGSLTASQKNTLVKKIDKAMQNELVMSWFRSGLQVLNEVDLLVPSGENLRPDRLLINENKEVVIVDYKFGQQKRSSYHNQVRAYVELIREMGYKKIRAYLWYFELNEIEELKLI